MQPAEPAPAPKKAKEAEPKKAKEPVPEPAKKEEKKAAEKKLENASENPFAQKVFEIQNLIENTKNASPELLSSATQLMPPQTE